MDFKRYIYSVACLSILFITSANSFDVIKDKNSTTKTFNEVDDSYDTELGKMWYQDKPKKEKIQEQPKILQKEQSQYQAKDVNEAILQKLQEMVDLQKQQLELQKKTYLLLQEEYDPKPHMITNEKGEKCIANSSADCFEMPIVAEAKRVPVLAAWIKEPTIENATEYLKWQAKFFNFKFNNGYSLNLAGKQWGDKAYPAAATPEEFGSIGGESVRYKNELIKSIIASKSKNMNVYILMGKTVGFEIEYPQKVFEIHEELKKLGIGTKIVFKDSESLSYYKTVIQSSANRTLSPRFKEITDLGDVIVSKETFAKIDPHATPYVLLKYKDTKNDVTQAVAVGKDSWYEALQGIYRTLILNNIIKPSDLHGNKTSDIVAKEVVDGINNGNKNLSAKKQTQNTQPKIVKGKDSNETKK